MLRTTFKRALQTSGYQVRAVSMAAMNAETPQRAPKREGDISSVFASLSGMEDTPLPDRFRELKLSLVAGHEQEVQHSWKRLLASLQKENDIVGSQKSNVIPEVEYANLEADLAKKQGELRKRGAAIIRGVIPEQEARAYKDEVEEYVRKNPGTRGFPADNPQVFELYWSPPQVRARSHPNLVRVQKALMQSLWHVSSPRAPIDTSQPLAYADRLRIRQPGDAKFALGPHQDGGSVERWEREGYGRGGVYDAVFAGRWEEYDPWDASGRVDAVIDLYDGMGGCSMFRMFQGWLSMSHSGPRRGTLLVNPLPQLSLAYTLLRPFFRPRRELDLDATPAGSPARREYLDPSNWEFTAGEAMTSDLQGATPSQGQEFPKLSMHPHLELDKTMVHIPDVKPGDFVVWHCDTIHAVDKVHNGDSDSSVMYIPVCPTTEHNAEYLVRQRQAFLDGTPGPDFPGGKGEAEHIGRATHKDVTDPMARRSMGLEKLLAAPDMQPGAKEAVQKANALLGF